MNYKDKIKSETELRINDEQICQYGGIGKVIS
jgi:hypothetical protein